VSGERIARKSFPRGKIRHPVHPAALARRTGDADVGIGKERVTPGGDRAGARITIELRIAFTQQPESIFVEPEPYVQSVLFDPLSGSAAGPAFSTETPADLVDRDAVFSTMLWAREFERSRDRGTAAADDSDLDWPIRLDSVPESVHDFQLKVM